MLLAIVAVIIGLLVLIWSADTFIDGATDLAVKFNMPSFLIGVLILGVGTSAPEMVVSVLSAIDGSPGIALGNAFGSNIMNISLVLGIAAIISPIAIKTNVVRQDMLLLIAATALVTWQLFDDKLTQLEGVMMLVGLFVVLLLQIILSLNSRKTEEKQSISKPVAKEETSTEEISKQKTESNIDQPIDDIHTGKAVLSLMIGLILLIASSRAIVFGAVELAKLWGLSELLIGLTIVAVGTSLPELVASIVAARRGEDEMALGNIVGSNLFNTLGVVGLAAIIAPMPIEPSIITRDMATVAIMTGALFVLSLLALWKKTKLGRLSGGILLCSFVGYTAWLIQTAAA